MDILSYFKKPSSYVECSDYKDGSNDRFTLQRLGMLAVVSILSLFLTLYVGLQVGAIIAICANITADFLFSHIVDKYCNRSYLDTKFGDRLAINGMFWYAAVTGMIEGALFGGVATTVAKTSSKTRTVTEVVVGGLTGLASAAEAMHEIAHGNSPELIYRKRTKVVKDLVPNKTKIVAAVAVGGISFVAVAVGVALAPFTLGAGTAISIGLGAAGVTSVLSYFGISKYQNRKHDYDSNKEEDVEERHQQEDCVTQYQQVMRAIQSGAECISVKSHDKMMGMIKTHYIDFAFFLPEKNLHFDIKLPYRALPIEKFAFIREAIMSYRLTNNIGYNVFGELDLNTNIHKINHAKAQLDLILERFGNRKICNSVTHDITMPTIDTTRNHWKFDFGEDSIIDINLKLLSFKDALHLISVMQLHASRVLNSNLTVRFIDDHLDYNAIEKNILDRPRQEPKATSIVQISHGIAKMGNGISQFFRSIIHPREGGFADAILAQRRDGEVVNHHGV